MEAIYYRQCNDRLKVIDEATNKLNRERQHLIYTRCEPCPDACQFNHMWILVALGGDPNGTFECGSCLVRFHGWAPSRECVGEILHWYKLHAVAVVLPR